LKVSIHADLAGGKVYVKIRGEKDLVVFPFKMTTVVKRINLEKYFKKRGKRGQS
jgi:hypothetical protein